MHDRRKIAINLSLLQFLNTGLYAFILAFFPLYAEALAYSPAEIGILMVLVILAITLASPTLLFVSGSKCTPKFLVITCSLASILSYILLLNSSSFNQLALCITAFVFLKTGSNALFDVDILTRSAHGELRFEHIRVWGSIGFVVLGIFLGIFADYTGIIDTTKYFLAIIVMQSAISIVLCKLLDPKDISTSRPPLRQIINTTFSPKVILLFVTLALNWFAHAPLYVYLSLYLKSIGWNSSTISLAWNIGVLGEVLLFLGFRRLELKRSLNSLLILGMCVTVIRLVIMSLVSSLPMILIAQILHAFTFGLCYLTSIRLCYDWFPKGFKEKSQGLLGLVSVGIGGIGGRITVSYLARDYQNYQQCIELFVFASWVALAGVVTSVLCRREAVKDTARNTEIPIA